MDVSCAKSALCTQKTRWSSGHTEPRVPVYYSAERQFGLLRTPGREMHHTRNLAVQVKGTTRRLARYVMLGNMNIHSAVAAAVVGTALLFAPAGAPSWHSSAVDRQAADGTGWSWPLTPEPDVLQAFDPPAQRWLSGHRGVDLRAPAGAVVLAPAGGIVSFVGTVVDRPVIVLNHGSGLRSSFEPVRSSLGVGAIVEAGDEIGMVGTGAHCDRRCLHWGLRLLEEYIDPLLTIRDTRPSILLPQQNPG